MCQRTARQVWPAFVLGFLLVAAVPAVAGSIVVGLPPDPDNGDIFPFGAYYDGEYQQVYSRSQFSGPITITGLEFYNTQYEIPGAPWTNETALYMIALSTTAANWNSLSATYYNNIGADNTLVFADKLSQPWAFGDTLVINFSTPFTYNPANGNLLMDVNVFNAEWMAVPIFFDANGYNNGSYGGNDYLGSVYCFTNCVPDSGWVIGGYGMVTGFETVPEPGFMGVLGLTLAGMGWIIRRRRSE